MTTKTLMGENEIRRLAMVLLTRKKNQSLEALTPEHAAALLEKIESYPSGLGNTRFLVPVDAIEEAHLDLPLWEDVGRRLSYRGRDVIDVAYDTTTLGLLPILESWTGKKWQTYITQSADLDSAQQRI